MTRARRRSTPHATPAFAQPRARVRVARGVRMFNSCDRGVFRVFAGTAAGRASPPPPPQAPPSTSPMTLCAARQKHKLTGRPSPLA